jgi:hypothetical protein
MLVSQSLIFVHHPRTGGVSVREYLRKVLPDAYYPAADDSLSEQEKVWIIHQSLGVAHQYAVKLGLDPFSIPTLVCIRNPYSLVLSNYQFLRQRYADKMSEEEATFGGYLANLVEKTPEDRLERMANFPFGPFTGFLMVGESQPANLTVARTESLNEDVSAFVQQLTGNRPALKLPHVNTTKHEHFSTYYTRKEEEIVYRVYKNTFDSGLYKRYEGFDQRYQ